MNPILLEPAAAKAAHAALSLNPLGAASQPAPTSNAKAFDSYVTSAQGSAVSAQQLVGLKGADLQGFLSSLTEGQRVSVAQQLMGSTVAVQNSAGQVVQGVASKLQIQNGLPTFSVAGQNYSIGQLAAVLKPAYQA